jgi:SAM-dependent methyltransferase
MLEDSPIDLTGKRCIDFGCGHERPFSIGALLHLAGAKTVMGIDFSPAASLEDVAFGVYSMLAYILAKGCPANIAALGIDAGDLRRRIGDFDLAQLFAGKITRVPDSLYSVIGNYRELPAREREFDFLYSGSVLEHVADVDGLLAEFRRSIASDGRIVSTIDLRDHRIYGSLADNPWQFMIDDSDVSPGFTNKWRASQFLDAFERNGFKVAKVNRVQQEPPARVLEQLLPTFQALSDDDLKTTELWVTLEPA